MTTQTAGAGLPALLLALALAPSAGAQTLAETVRAALTTNPAAQASNAGVRAAALELLELRGAYLPRVVLGAGLANETFDDPGRLPDGLDDDGLVGREIELTAEILLFDGYARANRVYRNAARLDGAILGLLDASETLGLSAVQAHVDVARHVELLRVSDDNVARHREIRAQVDDLVAGGRLPSSAAFEIEERLLAARLARLEVSNALADARVRYAAIVGAPPGPAPTTRPAPPLPASREALVAAAVGNSFRVREAGSAAQAAGFEKGVRDADRYPTLSLEAGVLQGWDRFGTEGAQSEANIGFRVDWELYAGGRKARSGALTARAREALAERDGIVREVQRAAGEAWNAVRTGQERVVLLDVQRQAAENVVRQYREEFRAGTRTLIDVLDAERSLFNVRFEGVSARAAQVYAGYRALAARSGLARHFGVQPAEMPLVPDFVSRAQAGRPTQVFNTEIRALE